MASKPIPDTANWADMQLRQIALSEANECHDPTTGKSLSVEEIVERATAYYNFLKGESNG